MGRRIGMHARHALAHWPAGEEHVAHSGTVQIKVTKPVSGVVELSRADLETLISLNHLERRTGSGTWASGAEAAWSIPGATLRRSKKRLRNYRSLLVSQPGFVLPVSDYEHELRMKQPNPYSAWLAWIDEFYKEAEVNPPSRPSISDLRDWIQPSPHSTSRIVTPELLRWALSTHGLVVEQGRLTYGPTDTFQEAVNIVSPLFSRLSNYSKTPVIVTYPPNAPRDRWSAPDLQVSALMRSVTERQLEVDMLQRGFRVRWEGSAAAGCTLHCTIVGKAATQNEFADLRKQLQDEIEQAGLRLEE